MEVGAVRHRGRLGQRHDTTRNRNVTFSKDKRWVQIDILLFYFISTGLDHGFRGPESVFLKNLRPPSSEILRTTIVSARVFVATKSIVIEQITNKFAD